MKKSILVALLAIVLVAFVVFFVVVKNKDGKKITRESAVELTAQQRGDIVKEHHLELSKQETAFNGTIGAVTTLNGINIKILEIEGSIDDFEALKNMSPDNFSGDSVEIPTLKKTFKVVVDEHTKLIGFNSLEEIESGDQVMVDAGTDPTKLEEFTAIEIALNFRIQ